MTNKTILFTAKFGSRLYGTDTDKSDFDFKSIFLPSKDDLMMGIIPKIFKIKTDYSGETVPEKSSMPECGTETEYIPFHNFVRDFVQGQTYALEIAHGHKAYLENIHFSDITEKEYLIHTLLSELISKFSNTEIFSMIGFAKKQSYDYIHRAERLKELYELQDILKQFVKPFDKDTNKNPMSLSLSAKLIQDKTILDIIADAMNLSIVNITNKERIDRALEFQGRTYTESTKVTHFLKLIQNAISKYGIRTIETLKADVDFKSLSHAVRIFEQAIEILKDGKMTFPRPNAEYLLNIKDGLIKYEEVVSVLVNLEDQVNTSLFDNTRRKKTTELIEESEIWLLSTLKILYLLESLNIIKASR